VRILLLTHRLPYAPNRGDRIRAYHLVRVLAAVHEVHLVSLIHDADEQAHLRCVPATLASAHGVRVNRWARLFDAAVALPGSRPLTHVLLHSPAMRPLLEKLSVRSPPDVVLAYGTGMARYAFEQPLAARPCILDMVDVDSEKWAALAQISPFPLSLVYSREARLLRRFEQHAVQRSRATMVVTDRECSLLDSIVPDGGALVVPNGVDVNAFRPVNAPAVEPRVVFCGVFNYGPNEAGARWLASKVWPRVLEAEPQATLTFVGAKPTAAVMKLADNPTIRVTGSVEDVRPFLWEAAVSVAPLQVARGVQNKVLEAIAAGLPCVVTPEVLDGLPLTARGACQVASSAETFADRIVWLLGQSPQARRAIADTADLTSLSWEQQLAPLVELLARGEVLRTSIKSP
jgi:polysaccharide biosynthesis protein PslH